MRLLFPLLLIVPAAAADYREHPRAAELLNSLAVEHQFNDAELEWVRAQLATAQRVPKLIEAEQQAKERTLTWTAYRKIHLGDKTIANGRAFMAAHRETLARAESDYGVPASVITAVLGVETKYGAYTSPHRVLDALATQGFEHPTRSAFFFSELVALFALARERGFDPSALKGSYAGALGMAQFMPSNYRRLALDYDNDGRVDLWSATDAIGSVARYFNDYDRSRAWTRDRPIVLPASMPPPEALTTLTRNQKRADSTIGALAALGLITAQELDPRQPAGALELTLDQGSEWWIGLPNFYAIQTYNPRVYYAMAVTQLAQAIETAP